MLVCFLAPSLSSLFSVSCSIQSWTACLGRDAVFYSAESVLPHLIPRPPQLITCLKSNLTKAILQSMLSCHKPPGTAKSTGKARDISAKLCYSLDVECSPNTQVLKGFSHFRLVLLEGGKNCQEYDFIGRIRCLGQALKVDIEHQCLTTFFPFPVPRKATRLCFTLHSHHHHLPYSHLK